MKRLVLASLLVVATSVAAQHRSAELDKAYPEARDARNALQHAIARPDQGIDSLAGERTGSAADEAARKRYEAAMRRWNDLK
jgi:hypothetical protein